MVRFCLSPSVLSLTATEFFKSAPDPPLEYYRTDLVLWTRTDEDSTKPPAILPFQCQLTDDLPQCIHARKSQLSYSLTAILYHRNELDLRTSVLFHPRRYMDADPTALYPYANTGPQARMPLVHGDGEYSLAPTHWAVDLPLRVFFRLERSVIRLCDPLQIQVHIPSPSTVLVKEQGIMLQNVSATLVRVIQSHPTGTLYSDMDLLKRLEQDDSTSSDSCEPTRPCTSRASPDCSPQLETFTVTTTGKSCRFHSQRAIHLRLALHPGSVLGYSHASSSSFEPGSTEHNLGGVQVCESISQDTALHNIRFVLTIRVMVRGQRGEKFDVVTRRLVKIVPGPPPSLLIPWDPDSGASEKQSQDKNLMQEPDSMAALFTHATEYDGYDDTTARIEAVFSASAVQDLTLEEMSCTPIPNPDVLHEPAPLVVGDEGITPPDYQQVPPTESECSISEEELPDFHEAALYPPEPLPVTLPAWHTTSHYTGSPDENIPVEGLVPFPPTTGLPPSYIDSANPQDSMGDPSSELLPPAYAPPPAPSDPAAATSVSSSSDPIFPPLYEA